MEKFVKGNAIVFLDSLSQIGGIHMQVLRNVLQLQLLLIMRPDIVYCRRYDPVLPIVVSCGKPFRSFMQLFLRLLLKQRQAASGDPWRKPLLRPYCRVPTSGVDFTEKLSFDIGQKGVDPCI
ncbi:hypothetical protein D3C75_1079240 [compost metagenome]